MMYHTAECKDGDLRLVAGVSELSGVLQVCLSQRWGTVNGDGWTAIDTLVACRQMGFNTDGKFVRYIVCVCVFVGLSREREEKLEGERSARPEAGRLLLTSLHAAAQWSKVYTVEPPTTDTPNNGHLPYNGQQSMYQPLFP